jgi:putative endonuclease
MYYVYVIKSLQDKKLYIGYTKDLKNRLIMHNNGNVKVTKTRRPFVLLFYEAFKNKKDAILDEKFFKTGYGREVLKDKIKFSEVG